MSFGTVLGILGRASCLVLLLATAAVDRPLAEVAVILDGSDADIVIGGIIEDPDPIPQIWSSLRPTDPLVLNPSGSSRGDDRPDWSEDPGSSWPVVVWGWSGGHQRDVALSRWSGASWTPVQFLARSAADERDPRVFVDASGSTHVVWWKPGHVSRLYHARSAAGATMWDTQQLTPPGPPGRRPSIAIWYGKMHLAYERSGQLGEELAVASFDGTAWTVHTIAMAQRGQVLDAVLHVEDGLLWIDWKATRDRMAYSRFDGTGWSLPSSIAWNDPTWFGEMATRETIRQIILGR